MVETAASTVGDKYVLATGDDGAARLGLLDEVYGHVTRRVCLAQGLASGWHVAEIGCGTGQTTSWLAEQVGPSGRVAALDVSADQLALARDRASGLGLDNVSFVEGNAYEPGLEEGSFDLVFCRFVLCHLQRPADAVACMAALLRPGGVLVSQEPILDMLFADPPSPAYAAFVELGAKVGDVLGVDYSLGRRLVGLLRNAGLTPGDATIDQPCFTDGEPKRFWEYTALEAMPGSIRTGLVDQSECDALAAELAAIGADGTTMVAQAPIASACGRSG